MKTEKLNGHERLEYYKELYVGAKNAHQEKLSELDTYMQQYLGSDLIDGSSERACAVRNITYEMIESEVSSDIPPPKVDPSCYSERRDRNAKSIERLLASVRDRLPYEEMNDLDERYTYVLGSSVWYAEWDNEATLGNEIGAVKLHCLSPQCFIGQPNIPSVEDMEYCFLEFTSTRGELIRKYNVEPSKTELADFDFRACSVERSLKASSLPTLLIHGTEDRFVPTEMSVRAARSAPDHTELLLVENARHGQAIVFATEEYLQKTLEFLEKNL